MSNEVGASNQVKEVLIVSISAPPYTSPESVQCSKYLKYLVGPRNRISLVTAEYPDGNLGWRKVDATYQSTLNQLKQIIKVPAYYPRIVQAIIRRINPRWFKKPDNERRFISGWKKVIKRLKVKPDLIYSRSSPLSSTLMALKLYEYYKVPWVIHLSDPWAQSPILETEKGYHRLMEKHCFDAASKVCLTSRKQIELYRSKYPHFKHKFELYPNVYDHQDITFSKPDFEDKLTFVHTGNFYGSQRSPGQLLKAIEVAHLEKPEILNTCQFLFAGFQDDSVSRLIKKYENYGVRYIGPLDLQQCRELQRRATILMVIDMQLPAESSVFFPSKTLDYVAANKPILALTAKKSALHEFIENGYGSCFEHNDIAGIKDYLVEMIYRFNAKDELFQKPYQITQEHAADFNATRLSALMDSFIVGQNA